MDDHKLIRLFVEPEISALLEKHGLKDEDLQKTIYEAEQTGKKFVHPGNGHFLAGVRQQSVTVWVEYGPRAEGYEIYGAYLHRVKISAWDFKTGRTR
jgi:glutamate synthase (NADPH/NADH) small chain